ncbi:MAG: hypothetical protein O3C40_21130 [Planctomycetota bacterium]|nr:hypothetical protein [Planctomycetota bacterium]
MPFELFDPDGELRITAGDLPHWYQPGVTYFVTFRTEDSIPVAVADLWYGKRRDWLARHGISVETPDWREQLAELPELHQNEFHNTLSQEFLEHLDKGLANAFCDKENSLGSSRTACGISMVNATILATSS